MDVNIRISGMTLAVTDMQKMVDFYENVFSLTFKAVQMYGATLFEAQAGNVKVLFCPAEIAQNTATQNRHQLAFQVRNLENLLPTIKKYHGELMGDPTEQDGVLQVGIKDPDNNSMVLKQFR
ncbi:MAG: hypothetical protein Tsb0034_13590 [Ekhidna sp.]